MKHPKLRKELFLAIIFSSAYLLLKIFYYHLDKLLLGINIDTITNICFLFLLALLGIQIFKIFRRRRKSKGRIKLKFAFYLPSIVLLIGILYRFSPVKLDSEKLESKVVLRGCFENGISQASIKFRANKNFEIKWINETGFDEWFSGSYKQNKDTLFLTYFDKLPQKLGSILLNTNEFLVTLDKLHVSSGYYVTFNIGDCKTSKN